MRIFIDSNTFPASPAIYADAERKKPLPRTLPAVELQRGGFAVAFVGDSGPKAGETLALAASIESSGVQVVAEYSNEYIDGAWGFKFALTSAALIEEVTKRGSARLLVGIIAEDDALRREWQFSTVVYPSASSEETDEEAVESAKNFADVAERAATRAEEAARNSEQSTQDASESAVASQASAEAASKSQEAAAQSAKEAAQSKTDAVFAKNAAETAKTDAEKAKTDAEAVKAGAERARDDANEILRNVESEAESVKAAGEQALVEIETSKQEAKAEIAAFTDVYTKAEIDGVATGAEVTLKMNEIIAQLKDWEEVAGEKLPLDFWEAVMAEFQRWQENPNEVKEWVTTSATESTNPYFSTPPTKPVVDFNVAKAVGIRSRASFSPDTDQIMYFPNLESGFCMFYNCKKLSKWKSPLQSLTNGDSMFMYTGVVRFNTPTPKLTNGYRLFLGSKIEEFNGDLCRCTTLGDAFEGTPLSVFSANLDSLSTASAGFTNTRLPAEQISKILDSLPTWTDGKNHIIAFTGSPGAAELTQESPSVAAAIAKGWTVEL